MQVSYKTITTLEYDIYTGTYKNVEKQVQDTQASAEFADLLQNQGVQGGASGEAVQDVAQSTINSALSSIDEAISDLNSIIYSLKFGANQAVSGTQSTMQNAAAAQTNAQNAPLQTQNNALGLGNSVASATQSNDDALKSKLMSDLLNVLN